MRECFCFVSEAVNASGEAVRGLVKSRVSPLENSSRNMAASPAHASRQLRRLTLSRQIASLSQKPSATPFLACVASVSVQFGSKELQGDEWSE